MMCLGMRHVLSMMCLEMTQSKAHFLSQILRHVFTISCFRWMCLRIRLLTMMCLAIGNYKKCIIQHTYEPLKWSSLSFSLILSRSSFSCGSGDQYHPPSQLDRHLNQYHLHHPHSHLHHYLYHHCCCCHCHQYCHVVPSYTVDVAAVVTAPPHHYFVCIILFVVIITHCHLHH